jgi:hypothetical protein
VAREFGMAYLGRVGDIHTRNWLDKNLLEYVIHETRQMMSFFSWQNQEI